MKPSDTELIKGILNKNPKAFDTLYARYRAKVRSRILRIVRDEIVAEDLTQEVFLRVWTKAKKWRKTGTLEGWLYRMATNLALNHLRSIRRRKEQPLEIIKEKNGWDEEDKMQVPGWMIDTITLGADEMVVLREQREIVQELLERLPEEQKDVIRMAVDEQMDIQSVSEALGIPKGTVKSRLHYARKRLEKDWQDNKED